MRIDAIRAARCAVPFCPFTVHLIDGRRIHVADSECLLIGPQAEQQFIVAERGEDYTVVTVDSVDSVEFGRGPSWLGRVWRRWRGLLLGLVAVVLGSVILTWGIRWYNGYRLTQDPFLENPEAGYRAALDRISDPEWASKNPEWAKHLHQSRIPIDHFRSIWLVAINLLMEEHRANTPPVREGALATYVYAGVPIQRSGYQGFDEVRWQLDLTTRSTPATLSIYDTRRACGEEVFDALDREWLQVAPKFDGAAAVGLVEAGEQVIRNVRHNMSVRTRDGEQANAARSHESLASTGFYNVVLEATTEGRVDTNERVTGYECVAHLHLTLVRDK